jgi:hypothetical protein
VSTALGLIGVVVFIACVIALAATVTWVVVKVTPPPGSKTKSDGHAGEAGTSS